MNRLTTNPFATHCVRPGRLAYRFSPGQRIDQVLESLRQADWCGQMVGPHGTGKTTLLRTLDEHWNAADRKTETIVLRNGQRRMPAVDWNQCDSDTQVIVDGYEQLSYVERWLLRHRCRRHGCGLLVTTHRVAAFLPVVFETTVSRELVRELVRNLAADAAISSECIDRCFEIADHNVRETFMLLYDEMQRIPSTLMRG